MHATLWTPWPHGTWWLLKEPSGYVTFVESSLGYIPVDDLRLPSGTEMWGTEYALFPGNHSFFTSLPELVDVEAPARFGGSTLMVSVDAAALPSIRPPVSTPGPKW